MLVNETESLVPICLRLCKKRLHLDIFSLCWVKLNIISHGSVYLEVRDVAKRSAGSAINLDSLQVQNNKTKIILRIQRVASILGICPANPYIQSRLHTVKVTGW